MKVRANRNWRRRRGAEEGSHNAKGRPKVEANSSHKLQNILAEGWRDREKAPKRLRNEPRGKAEAKDSKGET